MRTVMTFATQGDGMTLTLDLAPANIAGQGESVVVVVPDGTAEGVEAVGGALATVLNSHPTVKDALRLVLAANASAPPSPLYFDVRAPAADALLWEALFVGPPVGFCALDRRWPVGRIASDRQPVEGRVFTPPLRIVAVLAANGRRGLPQFEAMRKAVTAERPEGSIPAVLHVIAAEDEVVDAATRAAAADPRVTVTRITGNAPDIAAQIDAARPHVLHVLSHGGRLPGPTWALFLATSAETPTPRQRGSVSMSATMLVQALEKSKPWLVVLGACSTADATDDGPALAHRIASSDIVPAVVGMRRMVDLTTMDRFCKQLYPQVLARVDATLTAGEAADLDWAAALTDPRIVLSGARPAQVGRLDRPRALRPAPAAVGLHLLGRTALPSAGRTASGRTDAGRTSQANAGRNAVSPVPDGWLLPPQYRSGSRRPRPPGRSASPPRVEPTPTRPRPGARRPTPPSRDVQPSEAIVLAERQGRLAALRSYLAALDADAPPSLVADLRDRIAALGTAPGETP